MLDDDLGQQCTSRCVVQRRELGWAVQNNNSWGAVSGTTVGLFCNVRSLEILRDFTHIIYEQNTQVNRLHIKSFSHIKSHHGCRYRRDEETLPRQVRRVWLPRPGLPGTFPAIQILVWGSLESREDLRGQRDVSLHGHDWRGPLRPDGFTEEVRPGGIQLLHELHQQEGAGAGHQPQGRLGLLLGASE